MQEKKTKNDLSCTCVVCEEGAYSMFLTTLNSYKKKQIVPNQTLQENKHTL